MVDSNDSPRPALVGAAEQVAVKIHGSLGACSGLLIAGSEMVPVYEVAQERGACPTCGSSQMYFSEGCVTCVVCGFSECG